MAAIKGLITKGALKALTKLLGFTNETVNLLKKIDTKLDTQVTSKLCGELNLIQTAINSPNLKDDTLNITIHNLSETSEYFKSVTRMKIKELNKQTEGFHFHIKTAINAFPFMTKFMGRPMDRHFTMLAEVLNYLNLFYLSEIGKLICMTELGFSKSELQKNYSKLQEYGWPEEQIFGETSFAIWCALKKKRLPDDCPSELIDLAHRAASREGFWANWGPRILKFGKEPMDEVVKAIIIFYKLRVIIDNSRDIRSMIKVLPQKNLYLEA